MSAGTGHVPHAGAVDAVTSSLSDGWRRMTWMMFHGPHASLAGWAWWGLILLLSGATNLGSGGSSSFSDGEDGLADLAPGIGVPFLEAGWIAFLIGSLALVGLLLFLVWLYVRSRFRFVAVDGIMSGSPSIRDVWPRTSAVGMQYFVFEVVVSLICLVVALPVLLAWLPLIAQVVSDNEPSGATIVFPIVISLLILIPLAIAKGLLDWFVYDVTLPVVWLSENDFWSGFKRSLRLLTSRLGACVAFLLARIVIGIVGSLIVGCLACMTCVIWIWPGLFGVALLVVSLVLPPLLLLTLPVAIGLFLVSGWIVMTVVAPLFVFYRAWSVSFAGYLDPDLPRFELPPPAAPAAPAAPPVTGAAGTVPTDPAPPAPADPASPPSPPPAHPPDDAGGPGEDGSADPGWHAPEPPDR